MRDEVRSRSGHRVIPPAELPPGAIGWNIYEQENPGEIGRPSDAPWEFIGFIPAPGEHQAKRAWLQTRDGESYPALSAVPAHLLVTAPFTQDQVASLDGYQESPLFDPFMCGDESCRSMYHVPLIAFPGTGWQCAIPDCSYTLDWCYSWMADWSWKREPAQ